MRNSRGQAVQAGRTTRSEVFTMFGADAQRKLSGLRKATASRVVVAPSSLVGSLNSDEPLDGRAVRGVLRFQSPVQASIPGGDVTDASVPKGGAIRGRFVQGQPHYHRPIQPSVWFVPRTMRPSPVAPEVWSRTK